MAVKRSGLGRNLSALLNHTGSSTTNTVKPEPTSLSIDQLQPGKYQPRSVMDDPALNELANSIKQQGLLQPLVVREIAADRYEIIAGERRWRACKRIGMSTIPVVLRQVDDETAMAMALVENLQREDLNALEQARAMHRLTTEFGLTHQQIADLLCKSRAAVSNFLRLLQLSADVCRLLEQGDLDMGHARCLLMLDEEQQSQAARLVVARGLSVRETEALVAKIKAGAPLKPTQADIAPLFTEQLNRLAQQLATKVRIKPSRAGKGELVIHYDNSITLERMIEQLMN